MIDLSTEYLGLEHSNPIVPSASSLSREMATALTLEDAGASGLVMHSLFEEKIANEDAHLACFFHQQSIGHAEAIVFIPYPMTI